MRYDSFSDYALDDLYRPAALVSAVILFFLFLASPAQANYIYNNATGQWTPTARTVLAPPGAGSPFNYIPSDTSPTVSSTGAFQNKTGGTFGSPPVNGASRTVPVTINGTTTKPNVNKALLSRLGKGGLASLTLGLGIEALLNGIGALISEGGTLVMKEKTSVPPLSGGYKTQSNPFVEPTPALACSTGNNCTDFNRLCSFTAGDWSQYGPNIVGRCSDDVNGATGPFVNAVALVCPPETVNENGFCVESTNVPVPPNVLDDAINSGYQPHPSDYPFLSSDPAMIPTIVGVDPISRINIPPATTTTIDLDTGKTTTVETNIWQDFNIKDNNTAQPKIETETTTKTETYTDGEKTGETTITNNTGTMYPEGATDSEGNRLDIPPPIDCDLFPTACAWMEWTQEEPEEPDDNLSDLLQEVPIVNETYTISGGVAGCPAPLVLNLSQFGSRTVSYQPLCDLASTMKFLYLALMSFAAAVLLHRSISRV